tara:strand:+ start:365 stop:781 length:417 start_codon:yes stop_codon:yes gene_type:complete
MPLITKQYKFCAAHRYWNAEWNDDKNFEVFQEDVRLHGHNYELDITVGGPIDADSGFIIDISKLNRFVNEYVIKQLDHSQIDKDIEWFENKQPSTENLVIYIWKQIAGKIPDPAYLYCIKLRETPTIYTEYYGPEGDK